MLPAGSVARTSNVWGPSPREAVVWLAPGPEQAEKEAAKIVAAARQCECLFPLRCALHVTHTHTKRRHIEQPCALITRTVRVVRRCFVLFFLRG